MPSLPAHITLAVSVIISSSILLGTFIVLMYEHDTLVSDPKCNQVYAWLLTYVSVSLFGISGTILIWIVSCFSSAFHRNVIGLICSLCFLSTFIMVMFGYAMSIWGWLGCNCTHRQISLSIRET